MWITSALLIAMRAAHPKMRYDLRPLDTHGCTIAAIMTGEAPMAIYLELSDALARLEAAMRAGSMWRQDEPDAAAMASREPFCIDTLTMPQWLRFVLVARLKVLIDQRLPLPQGSQIAPAAELYLKGYSNGARMPVIGVLREIDVLLGGADAV
ncbi:uncharacterized protein conserved in bacteria [Zymobacter palmae]|uniref:Uncharacterized protein conserved in bacteria n=2 Tax=Zymobacter palmae TaxID=33074 RepID=A0A348HG41_9GAMM|nr:uncharacterized protein conserved in bacteria [Zymobacter palmae]